MLDPGRVGFTTFGEGLRVVDLETGEMRESTKQDVADTARLADYLDELDTYELAVGAHDVPAATATIHNYEAAVCNTTKHVSPAPSQDGRRRRSSTSRPPSWAGVMPCADVRS